MGVLSVWDEMCQPCIVVYYVCTLSYLNQPCRTIFFLPTDIKILLLPWLHRLILPLHYTVCNVSLSVCQKKAINTPTPGPLGSHWLWTRRSCFDFEYTTTDWDDVNIMSHQKFLGHCSDGDGLCLLSHLSLRYTCQCTSNTYYLCTPWYLLYHK